MSDVIRVNPKRGTRYIHIETDLAVINIYLHLSDVNGARVENIQIQPNNYSGEPKVHTDDDIRGLRIYEDPPTK